MLIDESLEKESISLCDVSFNCAVDGCGSYRIWLQGKNNLNQKSGSVNFFSKWYTSSETKVLFCWKSLMAACIAASLMREKECMDVFDLLFVLVYKFHMCFLHICHNCEVWKRILCWYVSLQTVCCPLGIIKGLPLGLP